MGAGGPLSCLRSCAHHPCYSITKQLTTLLPPVFWDTHTIHMTLHFVISFPQNLRKLIKKNNIGTLASMAQVVGALSHRPKGHKFNSQSGHMPRLWVQSPVRAHITGNQSMFLSLSLLSPFPSLSKINKPVLG